jgi:hypothetical protein
VQGLLGYQLYACGKNGPPEKITFEDNGYELCEILKHDFFAATALYELYKGSDDTEKQSPRKIILKLHRRHHFLGLPLLWLGENICQHEVSIIRRLTNLPGIPNFLSRYDRTGLIYEYIEGRCLDEVKETRADFFEKLLRLLQQIHNREIVYLDMNKRSNILIGNDGRPYLIDFQISMHIGENLLIWPVFSRYFREVLQQADLYHLFKHKRKLCSESLTPDEQAISRYKGGLIGIHRSIATPYRKFRRALLKFLYTKGLAATKDSQYSSENDIARFTK